MWSGKKGIVVRTNYRCCMLLLLGFMALGQGVALAQGRFSDTIQAIARHNQHAINQAAVQRFIANVRQAQTARLTGLGSPKVHPHRRAALLIFVSSDMPLTSLHQYVMAAQRVKAALVLRGLVKGTFRNTARFVHRVLDGARGGISIDPIAFERLGIHQVPAIVLFNPAGLACLNAPDCTPSPSQFDVVYGQVTLAYALEQMAHRGQADRPARPRQDRS